MKGIYLALWKSALPYYEKGRVYDIEQIKWMMAHAERIAPKLSVDERVLYPLIILHDLGYSVVSDKNPNIKDPSSKRLHMREGSLIARRILDSAGYEPKLTDRIVRHISVHDNWVFGDDEPFKQSLEMALFNDFDFLFSVSSFYILKKEGESMGLSPEAMYEWWLTDEKLTRRPFCCDETRNLFKELMDALAKEFSEDK
jgi:hypothetical protein